MKSISRIFLSILAVLIILTLGSCDLFGPGILVIKNIHGTLTIDEVRIKPWGSLDWGDDLLGSNDIAPGSIAQFQVNSGDYDVRVKDSIDNEFDATNVYVASGDIIWLYYDGSILTP